MEFITALFLLVALYGFAVWTILPPADVYVGNVITPVSMRGVRLLGGWIGGVRRVAGSLLSGVTEPILFAIPLWIAIIYAMHKRRQTFYLIPVAAFAACSLAYLMFWHAGLVIPLMIAVFWIAQVKGPRLHWPTSSEATALLTSVIYLFAVQLGWTVHAVLYDHFHDYSPDLAAARFLSRYIGSGDEIAVTYLMESGPQAADESAKNTGHYQNGINETLSYYALPPEHWRCLRTNNPLERLMREIRRRTRVGAFPDGNSALMLVAARLRHVASTRWGSKRYLQMNRLAELVAIA